MPKTKTVDAEARAQIAALGLNPDAPAFGAVAPTTAPDAPTVPLAPEGVDPHTMPVADLVFDPRLLDDFPSLDNRVGRPAAARYLFDLYKYPRSATSKDRNRRLQDEIGLFIIRVRRTRESGTTHVKDQVRQTAKQRDLLALLAEHGIQSIDDLKEAGLA
jgi:hypothetical protein